MTADAPADADSGADLEARVFKKVRARLIPILMLCYFVSFLDRVNVGFAALQMNRDLGFGPGVYGWGAGIFFLGYFVCEVPSNVMLELKGARIWIARIMISWGLVSMANAAIRGTTSFYVLRLVLGAAEAGFYPGVIIYLSAWFPSAERAKVFGWFTVANPVAAVLGAPLSGAILSAPEWLGVRSWQVLFLIEGLPAVVLGWVVWRFLDDRPEDARWLSADERALVARRVAEDAARRTYQKTLTLWQGLSNPRVLMLGAVYFGCIAGNYGLSFWLPQIVKAFGVTNFQTGLIAAVPYAFGAAGMVIWSHHSDRTRERFWHVVLPLLLAGAALLLGSRLGNPVLTMALMCLAAIGIFANTPPFWTWPTSLMGGVAAAGGVALVNSLGNLSGFVAPFAIGAIKRRTGSFQLGLAVLGAMPLLSALLMALLARAARGARSRQSNPAST